MMGPPIIRAPEPILMRLFPLCENSPFHLTELGVKQTYENAIIYPSTGMCISNVRFVVGLGILNPSFFYMKDE